MTNGVASEAGATAVVIPVKAFDLAKGRLAGSLSNGERARLAETMATGVLAAAGDLPKWVVCDDDGVAVWAQANGAGVIRQTSPGLNGAITNAVDHLHREGFTRVVIAHGDLPLATELGWVDNGVGVTIVLDRHGKGTNVMAVPTGLGFRFAYGVDSAQAHRLEAERLGLAVQVVNDGALGWDVDTPEDLAVLEPIPAAPITATPITAAPEPAAPQPDPGGGVAENLTR